MMGCSPHARHLDEGYDMYSKIICAVDLRKTPRAERALKRAATLLAEGGDIVLLHVVEDVPSFLLMDPPQEYMDRAIKDADEALTAISRDIEVLTFVEVRCGVAETAILAAAKEHNADLIVLASHVPNISNYFLGATADRVVRYAKCSVLVDRCVEEA